MPSDPASSASAVAGANVAQSSASSTATANQVASSPDGKADKHKRFENEGVVFKAKLIGSELVMEPRGDKMCQNSIQRLKAIIKGTNSHKKRVVLKISYDGVKVFDEKSSEMLHHHEVSQISYIASDDTDNRTFGYVSDVPSKAHQFICFKTSGPAISVMSVISALFEAVLEKKNQAEKEKQLLASTDTTCTQQQDSIDLIGDSGIVDGDTSLAESQEHNNHSIQQQQHQEVHKRYHQTHLNNHQQQKKQSSSSMLDGLVLGSPSDSFGAGPAAPSGSSFHQQLQQVHQRGQQSTSAADLIFDDLFAGLSDPIIVDKNESLVSYKQQQQHQDGIGAGGSGNFGSHSGSLAGLGSGAPGGASGSMDGSRQAPLPPPQQVPLRSGQHQQQHQGWQIPRRSSGQHQFHQKQALLPPPSSLPRPVPMMMAHSGPSHNRSLVYNHSSVSLSDAALTRQSSFTSPANNSGANQNNNNSTMGDSYVDRYAVFNDIDNLPSIFESASLGSVNKINQQQPLQPAMMMMNNNSNFNGSNNNNTSTSLGQQLSSSTSQAEGRMFRQRNPFDDDFFA